MRRLVPVLLACVVSMAACGNDANEIGGGAVESTTEPAATEAAETEPPATETASAESTQPATNAPRTTVPLPVVGAELVGRWAHYEGFMPLTYM